MLERMELENFKSFRGRHAIDFGPGLNCITGPNGAGKSNILEAVRFAFGESCCVRLRVKSMRELVSTASEPGHAGPTLTRVALHLRTRQNEPVTLAASLCAKTGHRTFRLNNRNTTLKHVKRYLRIQCGINVDISFWFIQQNFVHKVATRTPRELAGYLCEAAGTKMFLEYRDEATTAVTAFKQSATKIQENIAHMEETLKREQRDLATLRDMNENERILRKLQGELSELEEEALCAQYRQTRQQLNEVKAEEAAKLDVLSKIREEVLEHRIDLEMTRNTITKDEDVFHILEDARQEFIRHEAIVEDGSRRIVALRDELTTMTKLNEVSSLKSEESLRSRAMLINSIAEIKAAIRSDDIVKKVHAKAVGYQSQNAAQEELLCIAIGQVKSESKKHRAVARLSDERRIMRNLAHHQQEHLRHLREAAARVDKQAIRLDDDIEKMQLMHDRSMEAEASRKVADSELVIDRLNATIRHLELRMPRMNPCCVGEGDYGMLLDHVTIHNRSLQTWSRPLGHLIDKHLTTRVCANGTVAERILKANASISTLTIWPIANLVVTRRKADRHRTQIYNLYGDRNVKDPLDLLSPLDSSSMCTGDILLCLKKGSSEYVVNRQDDHGVERFKVVGSWFLVKDDAVGADLLKRFGIPSITIDLNIHSPGLLSGGFTDEDRVYTTVLQRQIEGERRDAASKILRLALEEMQAFDRMKQLKKTHSHLMTEKSNLEVEISQCVAGLSHTHHILENLERELEEVDSAELHQKLVLARLYQRLDIVKSGQDARCSDDGVSHHARSLADAEATLVSIETAKVAADAQVTQLQKEINSKKQDLEKTMEMIKASLGTTEALKETMEACEATAKVIYANKTRLETIEDSLRHLCSESTKLEVALHRIQERKEHLSTELKTTISSPQSKINNASSRSIDAIHRCISTTKDEVASCILRRKIFQAALPNDDLVNPDSIVFKGAKLEQIQVQARTIHGAIQNLEDGIKTTQLRSKQANLQAHSRVREELSLIFNKSVSNKVVDILPLGDCVESGVRFQVSSLEAGTAQAISKGSNELSGGQLTLLGMAYVLALARFSASPLYVLDEIDAALDEPNQRAVADLVLDVFSHSQVICISHHEAFHKKVRHLIQVEKDGKTSRVLDRVKRR